MNRFEFRFWDSYLERMIYRKPQTYDFSNKDIIPMQWTGLIDENRTKIFEGDLLVEKYPIDEEDLSLGYNESLLPVVWCLETLQWCVDASFKKDGSFLTSLVDYFGGNLKIKGNIYEQ